MRILNFKTKHAVLFPAIRSLGSVASVVRRCMRYNISSRCVCCFLLLKERNTKFCIHYSRYVLSPGSFMLKRITCDIALFISIFLLPWWLSISFATVLLFYFDSYIEAVIAALLLDLLYGAPLPVLFGFRFVFTISVGILFLAMEPLKKRLRMYN
jgi:hypothetical protein